MSMCIVKLKSKQASKQASKYVGSCACLSVVRLVCQSDPVRSDKTDGWTHCMYLCVCALVTQPMVFCSKCRQVTPQSDAAPSMHARQAAPSAQHMPLVRSGRKDGPGCQGSSLLLLLSTGCREVSRAVSLAQWQAQHLLLTQDIYDST
jgi:hypothetical protein